MFPFLIPNAARTSEVLNPRGDEIDLDKATGTIPAERMKSCREHRVPLTKAALIPLNQSLIEIPSRFS